MSRGGGSTDAVLVVDKPPGLTSHDVVARVRRITGVRRVGHAGTLDPMATGVLVLGVGRGTRLLGHLTAADKTYEATIRLGETTTTDDADGEVLDRTPTGTLTDERLRAAVRGFVGEIQQVPSSVSAVKVAGRRAYQLVREGQDVRLEPRPVRVSGYDVLAIRALDDRRDLDVRVECSSGTYVRALARDLGAVLGVGGHLTRLRRTRSGPFAVQEARTLDQLADDPAGMDLGTAAARVFPSVRLPADQADRVGHGRPLPRAVLPAAEGPVALLDGDGRLLALYRGQDDESVPVAVFVG